MLENLTQRLSRVVKGLRGQARLTDDNIQDALSDEAGVRHYAGGLYPLDEALIEVALDLSGRPFVVVDLPVNEALPLGNPPFNPQMAEHFLVSFATSAAITLHVTKRAGTNTHHLIEATFKGLARTLRDAVRVDGEGVPSTKGTLSPPTR